tara:strand:- start:1902 stop:2042 length:141 start_codon:yes stop_codon:yes gene_type:complete
MLIRDPVTVRQWPDMQLHGFSEEQLSDRENHNVIAYLTEISTRKVE